MALLLVHIQNTKRKKKKKQEETACIRAHPSDLKIDLKGPLLCMVSRHIPQAPNIQRVALLKLTPPPKKKTSVM